MRQYLQAFTAGNVSNMSDVDEVLAKLQEMGSETNVAGMKRFGITAANVVGIGMTELRKFARNIPKNHGFAGQLWQSGVHEARLLATILDIPADVTEDQMDRWAGDFDSWDIVDQCCYNLFVKTPFALGKCAEWAAREEQFVRRAGFSMMAALAVHAKQERDQTFVELLPLIKRHSNDDRNFVKKSVNWALRQIGKRNMTLHAHALRLAEEMSQSQVKSERWIGNDARRELSAANTIDAVRQKSR